VAVGNGKISSDQLVKVLCRNVRTAADSLENKPNDVVRTALVKKVLYKMGNVRGYRVGCSGIDQSHEWLLDVLWWRHTRRQRTGIFLGVECQWDCKDLMWDFQKLLSLKAPLKLFIYDGGDAPNHWLSLRQQFKQEMLAYHRHGAGETYLFVSFGRTSEYAHRFVVPNDGSLRTIEFEELPTTEFAGGHQ
jgi:hypothetical protein